MKVGDGAWCWFNEPRALVTEGLTIVGWVAPGGDVRVASLDNATGELVTRTLHRRLQYDDHANPVFHLRRDGRVTAFYSKHAGRPLYHRTTAQPAQVSNWGPERVVPTNTPGPYGYTYPNPVWSPLEARLYLSWRGGDYLPTYSVSDDDGETWAPARTLIRDNDQHSSQRPYVKYASRDGVIHVAYNQAHPRNRPTSVFYMRYVPGAGWQRAGGAGLGAPPFIPADGDRVYDARTHGRRSWVHDVAAGADGSPRLVFATFSRSAAYRDHRYWYAYWDGRRWRAKQMTTAGPSIDPDGEIMYTAGAALDPENPNIVYLARRKGDWFHVEVWRTFDRGDTWQVKPITGGARNHMRPVAPRGRTGTASVQVLFMQGAYRTYTTYQTDVMVTTMRLD